MLCYVNNDTVKGGETAVCLQNFILGQLAVAEVKLFRLI